MGKRKQHSPPALADSRPTVALVNNVQHFEASAKFKLSNIRPYFEDPTLVPEEIETPSFGPGYLAIHAREPNLAVFFMPVWRPETQFPITLEVCLTATASPSIHCVHINAECTTRHTWMSCDDDQGIGSASLVSLEDWRLCEPLRAANVIHLHVTIRSSPQLPSPKSPAALNVLYRTLCATHSRTCRFTVFEGQTPTGRLSNRRILSVDRDLIRTHCGALEDVLSGKSHWDGLQIQPPSDEDPARSVQYPDSDFEDGSYDQDPADDIHSDDGDSDHPDNSKDDSRGGRDDGSGDGSKKRKNEPSPAKGVKSTKPVGAEDGPSRAPQGKDKAVKDEKSSLHEGGEPMQVDLEVEGDEDEERAIEAVVVGAASITWEALVFYLHTGIIAFAPLLSAGKEQRATCIEDAFTDDRPRLCSPKSMYRLADKLRLDPLKQLCLNEISGQLSVRNILTELLSIFTSDYDEVKEVELQFLVQHSSNIMGSTALSEIMVEVAKGSYPHAGALLAEAWRRVGGASFKP